MTSGALHAASPRIDWAAALELLKPITWFAPMWAFGCGVVSSGVPLGSRWLLAVTGIALAGPLVCATSQAANDWFDRHVDAINEPSRPIPSGRLPGRTGLRIAFAWTVLSVLVAATLGVWVFGAALVGLALAWAYSAPPLRLKQNGWWGNLACGVCYEGLPWFTGAAVMIGAAPEMRTIVAALLYSAGAHGIMTLNDFKSVEGDRQMGIRSLPVILGVERAARFACWVMAVPQVVVIALLLAWGLPAYAAGVSALLVTQFALMPRFLRAPRAQAIFYNSTGTTLYVLGMLITAFALARDWDSMSPLGWGGIVRLGLVQTALGAVVVLCTSTLNRVMVVEFALPAIVPGGLVAIHYVVQVLRPRMGWGSDMGGRRTPWIVGGVGAMGAGAVGAAGAACLMPAHPWLGGGLALAAFLVLGAGVGAAGTSLLTLVAHRVAARRRAAAATILWLMMIAGIAITAGIASKLLDPFSPARLIEVMAAVAGLALLVTAVAVWRVEGDAVAPVLTARQPFRQALMEIWAERQARNFALFVFVSMLAYSAQELLLEPFAGAVFGFTPGQTAGLTGLQHAGVLVGMAVVAIGTMLAGEYRGRVMRAWTTGGCLASALAVAALAVTGLMGPAAPLRAIVLLLGVANGAFAVSAIGAMMGLAAEGRASRDGTRIGLWGAAQALAFGAGGLVGTGASDLARMLLGTPEIAYAAVFSVEAAAFVAAAWLASGLFGAARRRPVPSIERMQMGMQG